MRQFALVLHTHLPFVRRNGTWPCGEDFFNQAAVESYLPLLGVFERLASRGLDGLCTVGITPDLAHQMADAHMQSELEHYLGRIELRALRQVSMYAGVDRDTIVDAAAFYARHGREQAATLERVRTIAGGFAALERNGIIELAGGPATHPLLPQIAPWLRTAQLRAGLDEHQRIFGRRPSSIWVPECAVSPGIEEGLARAGAERIVVDPAAVRSGRAFRAGTLLVYPMERDVMSSVWCADGGYPAGEWYRDFHAYDLMAGFKNWRVTSRDLSWLGKEPYEPSRAAHAAHAHADAFVTTLEEAFDRSGRTTIVACFDTELLGHWWFEGPLWLERVLETLSRHPSIRPVTLASADEPVAGTGELRSSTWGEGSDFRSWIAPDVEELSKRLRDAEEEARLLLHRTPGTAGAQLLRELFLMQSSDWPYMIVAGRNAEYARGRFDAHHARFAAIADALRAGDAPRAEAEAAAAFEIDNLMPGLPGSPAAWEDPAP